MISLESSISVPVAILPFVLITVQDARTVLFSLVSQVFLGPQLEGTFLFSESSIFGLEKLELQLDSEVQIGMLVLLEVFSLLELMLLGKELVPLIGVL